MVRAAPKKRFDELGAAAGFFAIFFVLFWFGVEERGETEGVGRRWKAGSASPSLLVLCRALQTLTVIWEAFLPKIERTGEFSEYFALPAGVAFKKETVCRSMAALAKISYIISFLEVKLLCYHHLGFHWEVSPVAVQKSPKSHPRQIHILAKKRQAEVETGEAWAALAKI